MQFWNVQKDVGWLNILCDDSYMLCMQEILKNDSLQESHWITNHKYERVVRYRIYCTGNMFKIDVAILRYIIG